ncbi:glycosyltransferase family 61 protein [Candidatus Dependentiae bacterium]|nr:glycosyltransferase family 61 protein [Candidatus Dependentiae bacterium]
MFINREKVGVVFLLFFPIYSFSAEITLVSLNELMNFSKDIEYIKCHEKEFFQYKKFPLSVYPEYQPNTGLFAETFVIKIPGGSVCSHFGFVLVDNKVIRELLSQNFSIDRYWSLLKKIDIGHRVPKRIFGRVAVLTRIGTDVYGHWLVDVLGRLEILRKQNIEYDWLYVPYDQPYMRETLALLGVDFSKVITPYDDNFYIQADELIVPSLTIRRIKASNELHFCPYHPCTFYCAAWNIFFLRNSFLPRAKELLFEKPFPKKVFISRKDASTRKMLNEDQIFALFEPMGFVRVLMSQLTFLEQVALFQNAQIVVAAHGSCLTNLVFCNQGTKVIEIFQNQFDSGFWQLSDQLQLQHYCLKTQEDMVDCSFKIDTIVPIEMVQDFIQNYPDVFY